MSQGMQPGLRKLSNARQDSPAAEQQRSTLPESSPALTTAPHASPAAESFQDLYKSVWDRPLGAVGASESSAKPAMPPCFPVPTRAQEKSTRGSTVVPKSCFSPHGRSSSHRKGKVKSLQHCARRPKAPATRSGKKKPKTATRAAPKKRKIATDSSETEESDPLYWRARLGVSSIAYPEEEEEECTVGLEFGQ